MTGKIDWYKRMIDAQNRQNPIQYDKACDELGITIEDCADSILCQQGINILDSRLRSSKSSGLEKKVVRKDPEDIARFLDETIEYSNTSFEDYTQEKGSILRKYFVRFNPGESQDLKKYQPKQIGSIFLRLIKSYTKQKK